MSGGGRWRLRKRKRNLWYPTGSTSSSGEREGLFVRFWESTEFNGCLAGRIEEPRLVFTLIPFKYILTVFQQLPT